MHVFVLALGPVQDFIAAARRTRDLWFGSWLLSEMARAAGDAIEHTFGAGSLIFPAAERLKDQDATFANKIVARISGSPHEADRVVREAVRGRLDKLRAEAFDPLEKKSCYAAFEINQPRALAQIADLIEIQWASAPEGVLGYNEARREAERLLGARKQCRLFHPVSWGAEIPKSSIDGLRESVIDERAFDTHTPAELYESFRIDPAERLCGVSLLKRLGRRTSLRFDEHHFFSTGHLAAGPVLERLETLSKDEEKSQKLKIAWDAIILALRQAKVDLFELQVFKKGIHQPYLDRYDAGILFESRVPDLFLEEEKPRERRLRAKPILEKVNDFLGEVGVKTPCPYYAILHADGDRMGETIEAICDHVGHQALSSALSGFADAARKLVEVDYSGELVYAGGDDVLAFVPLHKVVRCAGALAKDFSDRLLRFGSGGSSPTLSVGVAVVHFLEPLQRSIELARRAEAKAKCARDDFNSKRRPPADLEEAPLPPARGGFALSFDKRSGPVLHLTGTWDDLDRDLEDLTKFHATEQIPDKAGYELRKLAELTRNAEDGERRSLDLLVRTEAKRILARKRSKRGEGEELDPEVLSRLHAMLDQAPDLDAFADRLIGSRLLAEARLQSQLQKPEEKSQ